MVALPQYERLGFVHERDAPLWRGESSGRLPFTALETGAPTLRPGGTLPSHISPSPASPTL